MPTMQAWHDFFLLSGGAAATLLGLVFVAASIAATVPNEKLGDERMRELWVLPIVWAFVRVLVVSAMGLIPGQTERSFGTLLLVLGLLDLGRMLRITLAVNAFHRSSEKLTLGDWGWYVVYPIAATLLILGGGMAMTRDWAFPVYLFAVGLLGHLVVGVHNAYELADWLATRE
jgi:hypothetical protein